LGHAFGAFLLVFPLLIIWQSAAAAAVHPLLAAAVVADKLFHKLMSVLAEQQP
jgi:hypothetical protein